MGYYSGRLMSIQAEAIPTIITDGLVLYLDGMYYSGTGTIPDISGNNNMGTMNGAGLSFSNKEWIFNGDASYINIPYHSSLFSQEFTMSVWVNITDFSIYRGLISKTVSNLPNNFDIYTNNASGGICVYLGNDTYEDNGLWNSPFIPTKSVYCNIVVVVNNTQIRIFIDGVLNGSLSITKPIFVDNSIPIRIGARADGVTKFSGKYKSVMIYNKAIADADIIQNYNELRTLYGL